MDCYYCYLIVSGKRTYIGSSKDLDRRVKQHNGTLKGGAKATRGNSEWRLHSSIGPFSKSDAYSFEWYWKHRQNTKGRWQNTSPGVEKKMERLLELLINYS